MRIDPSAQSRLSTVSESKTSAAAAQFRSILESKQPPALAQLKQDLKQVSLDFKSGKITGEQASKQFVDLVVAKKNELSLSQDDVKKVQTVVGEMVSQDPQFVSKLEQELKRI